MITIGGNKICYLTINTDASFCPKTRAGGYAFLIVHDEFKYKGKGAFKDLIDSSSIGETCCICNSLYYLISRNHRIRVDELIINTDSDYVIYWYKKCLSGGTTIPKQIIYLVQLVKQIENLYNCTVRFKESIKSHTNSLEKRNLANRWCDITSKKYMRQKRKEIQNASKEKQSSEKRAYKKGVP